LSAVMMVRETGVDQNGQPKNDPINVLAVTLNGSYTIGSGGGEVLDSDIAHNEDGNAVYGRDNKVDTYDFVFLMSVWGWNAEQIKAQGYTDPNLDYARYEQGVDKENPGSGNVITGQDGVVSAPEFIWMMSEWLKEVGPHLTPR